MCCAWMGFIIMMPIVLIGGGFLGYLCSSCQIRIVAETLLYLCIALFTAIWMEKRLMFLSIGVVLIVWLNSWTYQICGFFVSVITVCVIGLMCVPLTGI